MLRFFLKWLIFLTVLKTVVSNCSDPESRRCGSLTTRLFLNQADGRDTLILCSLLEKCTLEQRKCSHVRNPAVEESFSICRQDIPTTVGPTAPVTEVLTTQTATTEAPTSRLPSSVTPLAHASTSKLPIPETPQTSFPQPRPTEVGTTLAPVEVFTTQAATTKSPSSETPTSEPTESETPITEASTFEPPRTKVPFPEPPLTEVPATEAPPAETPTPASPITQTSTFEPLRTVVPESPSPYSLPTEAPTTNELTTPSDKCLTDKSQRCANFIHLAQFHAGQRMPNGILCLFLKSCTEEQVLCSGLSLIEISVVTSDCGFLPFLASILIPMPSMTTAPFPTVVIPISVGTETPVTFPTRITAAPETPLPGSTGLPPTPEMTSHIPVTYTISTSSEELVTPGTTTEIPVFPTDVPIIPSNFSTPSTPSTNPGEPAKKRNFSWLENWYSVIPTL